MHGFVSYRFLRKHGRYVATESCACSVATLRPSFGESSVDIDSVVTDFDPNTGPDSSLPPGFEDFKPRVFDHDFWVPLTDKNLGGSDAASVMAGITVPKTAPHIIHCTTGDAFVHTVSPPGDQPTKWKPDLEDPTSHYHSFPHVYPNPMDTHTVPEVSTWTVLNVFSRSTSAS
ncbi:hypothetical protein F2Q69_00027046 [Brassica cretica]|uniref:Uncharacterized protein n=1 Tax=Brassica cretica TaxID=69181 RepID=A0A8S9RSN0_BRACR|nr:hypothetical protein F2Q69_00027046 [Brassica cretica]